MEASLESQIYYGTKLLAGEDLQLNTFNTVMEKWQYIFNILIEKNMFYKLQYKDYKNFLKIDDIYNEIKDANISMSKQAFGNKEYFKSYFHLAKEIIVPVLIITGDEDYAIGPNHYKNFTFPNEKVQVIKGRHVLYIENMEKLKSVISEFLNSYIECDKDLCLSENSRAFY